MSIRTMTHFSEPDSQWESTLDRARYSILSKFEKLLSGREASFMKEELPIDITYLFTDNQS